MHHFDPKGVLRVIHCAAGGGGGAEAVKAVWPDVKIELQQVLIQVKISGSVPNKPEIPGNSSAHDLMTREEIGLAAMVSAKKLANQRMLGTPAIKGGGRGKESKWHYLQEKTSLEQKLGKSLPSLSEAWRIIQAKQSVLPG